MRKRYAIGIDPGVETGVAFYDRHERKIVSRSTSDFWNVIEEFETSLMPHSHFAVIEVASGHVIHDRVEKNATGFGRDRQAANVGSNRREAVLLAEGLERLGFEVRRVTPTRTKWTAKDLKQRTGITERTNQHVRDAIALVYGL